MSYRIGERPWRSSGQPTPYVTSPSLNNADVTTQICQLVHDLNESLRLHRLLSFDLIAQLYWNQHHFVVFFFSIIPCTPVATIGFAYSSDST